jgi:serine/threonine-protein kinase
MMSLYCSQGHANIPDSRFCRICGEVLSQGEPNHLLGWRYRIMQELGRGGFGRTYLAEDSHRFNERCVLKEFAPQVQGHEALQKAEELFQREAGILYRLDHPQIPRFRELFRTQVNNQDRLFLVQDYVQGQTYAELLYTRQQQGQTFSEAEVMQLLQQVLPVLTYIHQAGVIHRDISPDNLIQRRVDGLPVLIDFGGVKQIAAKVISQANPAQLPPAATRLGKVGYAPAEQMETGQVYPHSDLYALAATVLVLLTGKDPQDLLAQGRWQHYVNLSSQLTTVLERMLRSHPTERLRSAQDVWQALEGAPMPTVPSLPDPVSQQATVAVAPAAPKQFGKALPAANPVTTPPGKPYARRQGKLSCSCLAMLMVLSAITGSLVAGLFVGYQWLENQIQSLAKFRIEDVLKPGTKPDPGVTDPGLSSEERSRKERIQQRRQDLGIDPQFLVSLVDKTFHAKHPELNGRGLDKGNNDAKLRREWDEIALAHLQTLQALSPEARSRLGSYTATDLERRREAANQLNLSGRTLNDLADARFDRLFPKQLQRSDLLQLPQGQVWHAAASDALAALKSGSALEKLQFASGSFSLQAAATLQPGDGKAYLAQLTKDQMIRLNLRAAANSLQLSLYPPTSDQPPLLEDARNTEWSGKLPSSGLYEIVVVSRSAEPISYALDLAAAEQITTPKSSPAPSP